MSLVEAKCHGYMVKGFPRIPQRIPLHVLPKEDDSATYLPFNAI